MDSTLETFFKEINEIAPPKSKEICVWKECYDELTGYSYYWNMKTDEVTWERPANFVPQKSSDKHKKPSHPPIPNPVLPATRVKIPEDSVKIYSIGNVNQKNAQTQNSSRLLKRKDKTVPQKKTYRHKSDSEDEKITLITSYGGDSESETEPELEPVRKKRKSCDTEFSRHDSYPSDDDDDVDILTKIQNRAKELKALGGDLPPEVAKIADIPKTEPLVQLKDNKKDVAGFSLIAGYSDSEEENEEIKTVFSTKPEPRPPQISHSTLFPITKPVNVTDFIQPKVQETKEETNNDFDTKSFQRKKRIGIALVNTGKKKETNSDDDNERRGFGFISNTDIKPLETSNLYSGFTKGGVMFVKSDVLNPLLPINEDFNCDNNSKNTEEVINKQEITETYHLLVEKLKFLNEGRQEVSPTQIMVIQAQTLFEAMKSNGLKSMYLENWLNDTCSELVKLEKDATPDGWLLQWDRTHKRYYYLQPATGASQWEYPVDTRPAPPHLPPLQSDDDAMDISTTPPPSEQIIRSSPPLPPVLRSPTPPPPPIISQPDEEDERIITVLPDVPLPLDQHLILPPTSSINGEPLPPGVDLPDVVSSKESDRGVDSLNSELDSFYSEVAAIDTPKSISPQPMLSVETEISLSEINGEKKKKKKVKLAPGLSLKKKGVSQLVEKWKNVQQQFHD